MPSTRTLARMKHHDNTRFAGTPVVLSSRPYLSETHGSIEIPRRLVGLTDLEKNGPHGAGNQVLQQLPRDPPPAEFGTHREVQQLALDRIDMPRHQKSGDPSIVYRHVEIVIWIGRDIPLRRLRARHLNRRHRRQVAPLPMAES